MGRDTRVTDARAQQQMLLSVRRMAAPAAADLVEPESLRLHGRQEDHSPSSRPPSQACDLQGASLRLQA
jgi:hypothetical protein